MKKNILILLLSVFYSIGFCQDNVIQPSDHIRSDEKKEFSELKIYPNPCKSDKITVESYEKEISEIIITNIAGKQVLLKKFSLPENKKQLNLSEVNNGIYFVKIITNNGKQVVKKLIVSKD